MSRHLGATRSTTGDGTTDRPEKGAARPGEDTGLGEQDSAPTPTISVILPAFNSATVVCEAIQSILDQTFTNWELLIGDDGSSDGTAEVCGAFAARDSRVRLVRNEANMNVSRTRNRLIGLARAPFLAFQDADDISLPERFAKELEIFRQHPDVGVVSGMAAFFDDSGEIFYEFPGILRVGRQYPTSRREMVEFLYARGNKIVMTSAMVRREAVQTLNGPFDPAATRMGDWQFFLRLAHLCRFHGIPEVLVRMRRETTRNSLQKDKKKVFVQSRRCLRVLLEEFRNDTRSPIDNSLYRRAMSRQFLNEARFFGRRGMLSLLRSLTYDLRNAEAWKFIRQLGRRSVRRLLTPSRIARAESAKN